MRQPMLTRVVSVAAGAALAAADVAAAASPGTSSSRSGLGCAHDFIGELEKLRGGCCSRLVPSGTGSRVRCSRSAAPHGQLLPPSGYA
jgi:hypothetical protein